MTKRKKQKISGKTDRPPVQASATKPQWKYARYPDNDADWDRWYLERSEAVRAKFEEVFERLEDNANWFLTGNYRPLKNRGGLGEVRFHQEVQWRFVGFFGLDHQEFTVTMICYHKEDDYWPRDALDTAERRMKEIRKSKVQRMRCARPRDDNGED